ncbi:MAG: DNA adenine methylase [Prevotellaceae bacterium]|nr:DNA adenine methylase [Prevotellaceae bacterium]
MTYWGGKQQLTGKILSLMPPHERYNEPFFGGGAIFFAKQPAEIEFINDINGEMVNFYRTLKRKFNELKDEVDCTLHSEFQHNQAREIYANPLNHNDVLRAWAVWMLSHQSIYSILTNQWSVSIDKNKAKQIQNLKEAFTIAYARRLERTSIFCRDAIAVIKSTDTPTTFHYVDPPYYNADMGHYSGYTIEDFERLLIALAEVEGKFLLSSYPSELLAQYTAQFGWHTINIDMTKSSGSSGSTKTEVLTLNYNSDNISQQARLF